VIKATIIFDNKMASSMGHYYLTAGQYENLDLL